MNPVTVGTMALGRGCPPALIAGPCVLESYDLLIEVGECARDLARQYGFSFILKSSFEKANRSSKDSFRGPGLEQGLSALSRARKSLGVPTLTDVHGLEQIAEVATEVDCLQIPAFLCRQTELIEAAARTQLPVNIKKGQFLAPAGMRYAVEKAQSAGSGGVLITERGTMFGYGDLVVDMRALPLMADFGVPIIFDATHSQQKPGGGAHTQGDRRFLAPVARAAVATGAVDGLFIEVHPKPAQALSDAETQLPLQDLEGLLANLHWLFNFTRPL